MVRKLDELGRFLILASGGDTEAYVLSHPRLDEYFATPPRLLQPQRAAIEGVYSGVPGLSDGYRKWARDYIGDFFATIGNARRVRERIIEACPRDGR